MIENVETIDAVYIVNQGIDPSCVSDHCVRSGWKRVLLVTSHELFEEELALLGKVGDRCEISVTCFDDWLDDQAMQSCDDDATRDLSRAMNRLSVKWFYAQHFAAASMFRKNAELHRRLSVRFAWSHLFYTPGLGICPRYWPRHGAKALSHQSASVHCLKIPGRTTGLLHALRFLLARTVLHRIEDGERPLIFTSIRRLALRPGTNVERIEIRLGQKIVGAVKSRSLSPAKVLRAAAGSKAVVATTIHDFPPYLSQDAGPVEVFLDGFHPSNYPRTYLDQYGACVFVSADPFSVEWFAKHGRVVRRAPDFIDSLPMQPPVAPQRVRQILLALNHAGDWSSLINRSDTDRLVAAFCRTAELFPNVRFVVRPHPTMSHPAHEGAGSRERIARHIDSRGVDNLVISQASLEEDLKSADLVVSEYSQVLIDAFRQGKLGLIANLTNRRSFMIDFERCGFARVASEEQLASSLRRVIEDTNAITEQQCAAVAKYNHSFRSWMTGQRMVEFDSRSGDSEAQGPKCGSIRVTTSKARKAKG